MKQKVNIQPEIREADLMIIFSHPTIHDLDAREYCTRGEMATEVLSALSAADIDLSRVYFTAMVKHGIGSKPKPSAEDIEEWSAKLDEEIAGVKPKIIMPMGAEVFKRIMKSNIKMGDYLGELTDTPYGKVLANYAPGMIVVMDPTKRPAFVGNFKLAKRAIDNELQYDS